MSHALATHTAPTQFDYFTAVGAAAEVITGLKFDDPAKFLAGVKGRAESAYKELESLEAWKEHGSQMESTWEKFDQTQLKPARDFYKRELEPLSQPGPFVFYPFGGPDVVYVLTFYPKGKTYVLCGLDPVGSVPAPAWFKQEHLAQTFAKIMNSSIRRWLS